MELIDVKINGYRRFKESSSMNVASRMIAIVGPNEAGKSSFLRALEHINSQTAFIKNGPLLELSRGRNYEDEHVVIETTFCLEEEDRQVIAEIEDTKKCRWFTLRKKVSGQLTYDVNPHPKRSLKLRKQMLSTLLKIQPKVVNEMEENDYDVDFGEDILTLSKQLESEVEQLGWTVLNGMNTLSSNFRSSGIASEIIELQEIANNLEVLAKEEEETPHYRASMLLGERVPQFKIFGEDERELDAEYSLIRLKTDVPIALANLLRVAELDLPRLLRLSDEKDAGEMETIISKANLTLKTAFLSSWSQSKASVHLRVDNETLHVLVVEGDNRYVQIAERSDGLRQYVALLSFVRLQQNYQPPILLIDEVETHLHYDAQADLVQMLARQDLVDKVIYTTHSIGCLPEDLGTGVRIIEKGEGSVSRVQNWFWISKEAGFNPLLFGMGAQTLAFIPVRFAVIAEGAADMILLPSLFRAATGHRFLGFQIVPGLSEADSDALVTLEKSSPRTAYLTDSDEGGKKIASRLKSQGISSSRIFSLPEIRKLGSVTEDFVNPELYVRAINEEIRRSNGDGFEFDIASLPDNNRPGAIEKWCKTKKIAPPNKRAVAYHIVDEPDRLSIIDRTRRNSLSVLFKKIQAQLGLTEEVV